jgi:hypothetical protein
MTQAPFRRRKRDGRSPAIKIQALASALLLLAGGCALFGGSDGRPMSLRVLEGEAQLIRDGRRTSVTSEVDVATGDRILLAQGIAELRLIEGRLFEIEDAEVEITGNSEVMLSSGRLLADLSAAGRVDFEDAAAFADKGRFRVDRGLGTRVGVYSEGASVTGDGVELDLPLYREAVVAGGVIPAAPSPLQISSSDRWDRRFLEDALELDARLINFGRGLEAQLGALAGLPFFRQVLPGDLGIGFLEPFLGSRRSDLLIGLMIALEAGGPGDLPESFSRIFDLWSRGASWGLIAVEFGAGANGLFALLLDAIASAGVNIVTGAAPSPPDQGQQPAPRRSPGDDRGPNGGGQDPPPSPGPTESPDPVESIVQDVEDTAEEVECTLQGLLGNPCPE